MIDINDIKLYEKNAKKHPDEQLKKLAKLVSQIGWRQSVEVNQKGVIIVGHGRFLTWQKYKEEYKLPDVWIIDDTGKTIFGKHDERVLTEQQEKMWRLLDNMLNESEWIEEIKIAELKELNEEMKDLIGYDSELQLESVNKEFEAQEIPNNLLNEAWKDYCKDFIQQYDCLYENKINAFTNITQGLAKIYFLQAKYQNKRYPRFLSLAFHPIQFKTNGDKTSVYDGYLKILNNEIKPERLRFIYDEQPSLNKIISGGLPFAGARMPLDFPSDLAKELINEFGNKGNILDPCHGWGGRLVGFLLSTAKHYKGIDASDLQNEGVNNMWSAFENYSSEKSVDLVCSPFENVELKEKFDFALTSPPYFDVEKYEGGEQSHTKYSNYEIWRDSFYKVLIEKVYNALTEKGVFALQIGSQSYPLLEDGKKLAKQAGFKQFEIRDTGMINNLAKTGDEEKEIILILKK